MRYFLSYVVIQGSNTNTFGHAYSVLSRLGEGAGACLEVIESVGFYGDPVESEKVFQKKLFPAKLFGQGHLKQEHLCHIASSKSYQQHHKTWEISESEKDAWLRKVELDLGKPLTPRDFANEHAQWQWLKALRADPSPENTERLKQFAQEEEQAVRDAKGEYFSLFKHTCMTDAKCRLNALGIHTKDLDSSWLDVPGWALSPLVPMKLKFREGRLVWNSPLVLAGRTLEDFHPLHWQQQLKQFHLVYQTLDEVLVKFKAYLKDNPQGELALTQAYKNLKNLKIQNKKYVQHPQSINVDDTYKLLQAFNQTMDHCHAALKPSLSNHKAVQWLQQLMQWIQDRMIDLAAWLHIGVALSPSQFVNKQFERVSFMKHS